MIHNNVFRSGWALFIGSLLLILTSCGDDTSGSSSSPSLVADGRITQADGEVVITVNNLEDFLDQPFVRLWIVAEEEDSDGEPVKQEIAMDAVSDLSSQAITFTGLREGVRYKFSLEAIDADGAISSIAIHFQRQDNEDANKGRGIIIAANGDGPAIASIDEDGDGLIDIETAAELDGVRYQLDGRGQRLVAGGELVTEGCPGDVCKGYELMADIDLADYIDDARGWRPIGSDIGCSGPAFSGIFEGNGRTIRGLQIVRPSKQCVGLFSRITGEVRNLKLLADRIEGEWQVGGLSGDGAEAANVINVMVVVDELKGYDQVGGLVGRLKGSSRIISSLAIVHSLEARQEVGGLVGFGESGYIASSFAMTDSMRGDRDRVGGLVGVATDIDIMSSYAVTGSLASSDKIGGLVGQGSPSTNIVSSYALSGPLFGGDEAGGLIGGGGADIDYSYWDMNTSIGTTGEGGKTSRALVVPEGYSGIYASWDDINQIAAEAIWCDSNANRFIEPAEQGEANVIWDFGGDSDYPAIRCSPLSEAEQRSWWSINQLGVPSLSRQQLDTVLGKDSEDPQDRLDEVLDTNSQPTDSSINQPDGDLDGDNVTNADDVDDDGDGLIEISSPEQLNAIRYQLDAGGRRLSEQDSLNTTGCPIDGCKGYELTANISLAADYPNWQPIAGDDNGSRAGCQGEGFSKVFDGNGYTISDLTINRPNEDCVGLFGNSDRAVFRNITVIAGNISGRDKVGVLVGDGKQAIIIASSVVADGVMGNSEVGGLVGSAPDAHIRTASAKIMSVNGVEGYVGGLVGWGNDMTIIRSSAISSYVGGRSRLGGLVGAGFRYDVDTSFAITAEVHSHKRHKSHFVGGLLGLGFSSTVRQSWAITGSIDAQDDNSAGGLIGEGYYGVVSGSLAIAESIGGGYGLGGLVGGATAARVSTSVAVTGLLTFRSRYQDTLGGLAGDKDYFRAYDSYWDGNTSGIRGSSRGASSQTTEMLQSPTNHTQGIYQIWNTTQQFYRPSREYIVYNRTLWCDTDLSGVIEDDEKKDDNRAWDFGTSTEYPVPRCTSMTPAEHRLWYIINGTTGKPQLNRARLKSVLGSAFKP